MPGSNCCFLTCIQILTETGKVVWYSHLFKNFPQFVVSHIVKSFSTVMKWNSLAFSMIQRMLAILSLVPLPFLNPAWTSWNSHFTYYGSLAWRILSIALLACEMNALCSGLNILWHCPLGLEWKLIFSSPVATTEFSIFAGILSAALSQHHLLGFEIAQLEFHHLH